MNSTNEERRYQYESSNINNAYNLLANNVDKIKILIKSKGLKIKSDLEKTFSNKSLLEEIMDLQDKCMSIENDKEKKNKNGNKRTN